jgi:hypothetical protein
MSTRTFTDDEQASIRHALLHLEANKIADRDYPGYGGWYRGNLTEFVERHGKAIALLRSLLPPSAKEGRSGR